MAQDQWKLPGNQPLSIAVVCSTFYLPMSLLVLWTRYDLGIETRDWFLSHVTDSYHYAQYRTQNQTFDQVGLQYLYNILKYMDNLNIVLPNYSNLSCSPSI